MEARVFTSKFRILDSSAGRNWTDSDILHLIESYKHCRPSIANASLTSFTAATTTLDADRQQEKPETAEALFERVHAIFINRALNAQRTAKGLHEKFGFLILTYRRIREYETGKILPASPSPAITPNGVSTPPAGSLDIARSSSTLERKPWWEMSIKEQRQYLSKSMTPISETVYRALDDIMDKPRESQLQTENFSMSHTPHTPPQLTRPAITFHPPPQVENNVFLQNKRKAEEEDQPAKRLRSSGESTSDFQQFLEVYKQTTEEQKVRDEQILTALNTIGQMIEQLCYILRNTSSS